MDNICTTPPLLKEKKCLDYEADLVLPSPACFKSAEDLKTMIGGILEENRRRAEAAHEAVISTLLPVVDEIEPSNKESKEIRCISKCPSDISDENNDPSLASFYSNSEWTQLARKVTGPADALYSTPECSPFYAINESSHLEMKDRIACKVRSRKVQLRERWEKLSYEYAAKSHIYESQRKGETDKPDAAETTSESKIGRPQQSPSERDNKPSGHINPYRRPR